MMKHIFTLTLLCFGLLAHAQIPSYVPTNGLVGWWPFNGNANDESGNGNHGTVNGATLAADRFGNPGKAYSFDGVDDWIETYLNRNFKNGLTISVWINNSQPVSAFGHKGIFWNRLSGPQTNPPFQPNQVSGIMIYPNGLLCHASDGNNLVGLEDLGNFYNNSTWINVLFIFDNTTGISKIFSNGILVSSQTTTISMGDINFSYASTMIGKDGIVGYGNRNWNGLLDDIAIYNRALSAAEVQQLYLANCTQPTFTAQPQNMSVAQGQTTTFAVQVDTTATFQWQMNLGLGAGWVNIPQSSLFSGDTTATLTVQGRNPLDGAQFRCIATACQSDTSNAATLTVTSSASTLGSVAGVPGKINYHGAAVDSSGKPMKNQTIALKLSVLDSSSSGTAVYVESHTAATNSSGHFAIQIGGGTALLGTFDSVGWANGRNKYLKTELSQNGTWVNLGTSQLVSVPYALVSGVAKRALEFLDSSGNAYQIKTVNGQPTLVAAPGSGSSSNPGSFACGQSVTYAGESYPTVQIGTQCWFQKNLNVGTMILGANDQTNNSTLEKYCYNNDTSNCAIYGGLYQWAEAVQYKNGASNTTSPSPAFSGNVKGVCPTGWHVPSDGEWCTITTFLDSTVDCTINGYSGTNAGGKMKSTSSLWNSPNTGATNSSGFSALPGGYRNPNGSFSMINVNSSFWSSYEKTNLNSIPRTLETNSNQIFRIDFNLKVVAFPLRCLKD
jgi:uncharacterized protein (TIGR02145 family)